MRRALVVGAGPAGAGFAWMLKRLAPEWEVEVWEKHPEDAQIGFGVTMPPSILDRIDYGGPRWRVTSSYLSYLGERHLEHEIELVTVERTSFVRWLRKALNDSGVAMRYEQPLEARVPEGFDLVVGADGVNSAIRSLVVPPEDVRRESASTFHTWLSVNRTFDGLETIFRPHGGDLFLAFVYPYSAATSTFIVECTGDSWRRRQFGRMQSAEALKALSEVFHLDLSGARLDAGVDLRWGRFPHLAVTGGARGNKVLIGDAAHTANYAGGFGTLLALEDAVALAQAVADHDEVENALEHFVASRKRDVAGRQQRALSRHHWHARVMREYEQGEHEAVRRACFEVERMMVALSGGRALGN
ncbi:MAG: FAD-dependent monooxygenase [Sandaracinaceae bacterium]